MIIVKVEQGKGITVGCEGVVMDVIAETFAGFEAILKQIMEDTPAGAKAYNRDLLHYLIDELKKDI